MNDVITEVPVVKFFDILTKCTPTKWTPSYKVYPYKVYLFYQVYLLQSVPLTKCIPFKVYPFDSKLASKISEKDFWIQFLYRFYKFNNKMV